MSAATKTRRPAAQRKLDHLNQLIAHPATPAAEVAAAKDIRARLTEALKSAPPAVGILWEPRWAGEKYQPGRYLPNAEITALIRAGIKVARQMAKYAPQAGEVAIPDPVTDAIASAPAGIRFGVRILHYGSIAITVKNVPAEWGYGQYGEDVHHQPCEGPSPALYKLGEALNALGNQWNYDDSDAMVDYFNVGYYLNVRDEKGRNIGRAPLAYRYR